MGALFDLFTKLPAIFSIIHQIVLLVEAAFPNASGAQKLDAAVNTVQDLFPDVVTAAHLPGVATIVNSVVGVLNQPGGTFDVAPASARPPASGG